MTVSPNAACSEPFKLTPNTVRDAHWLPFASLQKADVTLCDVNGYFVVEDSENGLSSTFRGRNLLGMNVAFGEFSCISSRSSMKSAKVENLIVWNHDDMPLRSDVVPQAIALARVQNYLGTLSGLDYVGCSVLR